MSLSRSQALRVRKVRDVRYQTRNVERSLAFYTRLGFRLDSLNLPASARASMGTLTLHLTGLAEEDWRRRPGHRGRALADRKRIVLDVDDLEAQIESMKKLGFRFRNEIEEGPDGKRMRLEDPDGNPVDLVESGREPGEEREWAEVPGGGAEARMPAAHERAFAPRHALPRR